MKKNRAREQNAPAAGWFFLQKSVSENLPVFLVLALILLAVNIFSGKGFFFLSGVASPPEEIITRRFVWLADSPDFSQGLYQFSQAQLENDYPVIQALLSRAAGTGAPPMVAAISLDPAGPGVLALPSRVADIFYLPISINRADADVLASLPGIGPKLAEKIVERRIRRGPFRAKEDLLEIGGIGPKKYDRLADYITIE